MRLRQIICVGLGALASLCWSGKAAAQPCTFITQGRTWVLTASCVTTHSVAIPDGLTLDGRGHRMTAVDPPGGHFRGAVVRNGGSTAAVRNLRISASGLIAVCNAGADRLRGILFDGASGTIADNVIEAVNQGESGCQEGQGIEVRNTTAQDSAPTWAIIERNAVAGYQKTGILAHGNVKVLIMGNDVGGAGPIGYIAQNGIQVGFGATGKVMGNSVRNHSYTGKDFTAAGILVAGGAYYGTPLSEKVQIERNTLLENDGGVMLSQYGADGTAPGSPTRVRVIHNVIRKASVTNGVVYQAGVSDAGNGDRIISNCISGAGYNPATLPGSTFAVDASAPYSLHPTVRNNRCGGGGGDDGDDDDDGERSEVSQASSKAALPSGHTAVPTF